jgi:hypothetical protein
MSVISCFGDANQISLVDTDIGTSRSFGMIVKTRQPRLKIHHLWWNWKNIVRPFGFGLAIVVYGKSG